MEWLPIKRISTHAKELLDTSGLMEIEVELSSNPPREWEQAFKKAKGASILSTIHPPSINGKYIYITPPSDKIEVYIAYIDERINGANKYFENTILPMLQQKENARETEEKHKQTQIEIAQRKLDEID